jgi:hypothetical protein
MHPVSDSKAFCAARAGRALVAIAAIGPLFGCGTPNGTSPVPGSDSGACGRVDAGVDGSLDSGESDGASPVDAGKDGAVGPGTDTGAGGTDAATQTTDGAADSASPATHEPSGMTPVFDTGAITTGAPTTPSNTVGQSWSSGGPVPLPVGILEGTGTVQLSSSAADEPQSSGWRITFPAGQVNDAAMALGIHWASGSDGTGWLYMRWKERLGSTWSTSNMNAAASKLWNPKDNGGSNDIIMSYLPTDSVTLGYGTTLYGSGFGMQGPATSWNIPDNDQTGFVYPASDLFTRGVWNMFEALFQPDSPFGAGNGVVTVWVNGTLGVQATGALIFAAGATPCWRTLELYASRAVYSGTQTTTTFLDVDQIYVSLK